MLILHHTPLSPASRAIRIMLREKELDFELRDEDIANPSVELYQLNPAGDVPVMEGEKGAVICGGYAITEYLEDAYPEVQFFGGSLTEKSEVRRLVDWFDRKFDREVTQNIVFEKVFKRTMGYGQPDSEAIRAGKKNLQYHLDYIAYLLNDRNWLAGEYLTLADIMAASHLSCLDYLGDILWEKHQPAKDWYALIKSRPSFRPLLDDRVTGFRPSEHYTNLDF